MITIGPLTIMSTKTRHAYREMHQAAYKLHQAIWYSDDWAAARDNIMTLDMLLSDKLSHVPASDIESDDA